MFPPSSVLIVDRSAESREVLKTALLRSGTRILEAARAEQGLDMARQHQPKVIVVDIDAEGGDFAPLAQRYNETARLGSARVVVLGAARRQAAQLAGSEFVAKPYHYGPLIRRIEELLRQR